MTKTEYDKPAEFTIEIKESDLQRLVPQADIFAFTSFPVNLSRWSRTNFTVNLPRNPFAVFVQTKFPPNAVLTTPDNFSNVVTIATNRLIQVNTWRTDANADPSIDFSFHLLIIL
jgi:hypothetical protein